MSMGAISAGLGAAGALGGIAGGIAGYTQSRKAFKRFQKMSKEAMKLARESGDEYATYLDDIDANFDLYDVEDAFGQLEQSIIAPLERDFQENVIPQIDAAYGGGIFGDRTGSTAARAETVARASRGLGETKAQLRSGEQDKAMARNVSEFERKLDLGGRKYNIGMNLANLRMGQATQQYQAGMDKAATLAAAFGAGSQALISGSQALGGFGGGGGGANFARNPNTMPNRANLNMGY